MELRQLRHFVTLARTLNFRRAAEELNIAQPALSISIRKLEDEVGSRLFDRDSRGVSLTEVGSATVNIARATLEQALEITTTSQAIREGERGRLTIGFVPIASRRLFPRVLPAFKALYPDVDLRLLESPSRKIVDDVANQNIDVGIVLTPLTFEANCDIHGIETDRLVAILPSTHRFAGCPEIPLNVLRDDPFVMYSSDQVPALRAIVFAACWELGSFVPRIAQEAVQLQTIMSLVRSQLGVALVPSAHAQDLGPDAAVARIKGASDLLSVGLASVCAKRGGRVLVKRFIEALHQN